MIKTFHIKGVVLSAILSFFVLSLSAKGYSVSDVPNVQLLDGNSFVSNPDGILSKGAVTTIDSMLADLKTRQIAQIALIVIDSMADEDNYFFAHNILNSWGVGEKGRDNGLVILIAKKQREIQIETGYGLESMLPDAVCRRIENEYMIPYLSAEEWDMGSINGIKAIYEILIGEQPLFNDSETDPIPMVIIGFVVFMMLVTIIGSIIISRRQRKCPNCKKQGLALDSSSTISQSLGYTTRMYTYRCKYCGHITQKIVKTPRGNHMPGGPRGGGFSGGGFGGGSWGGGMSGGGGARSKF